MKIHGVNVVGDFSIGSGPVINEVTTDKNDDGVTQLLTAKPVHDLAALDATTTAVVNTVSNWIAPADPTKMDGSEISNGTIPEAGLGDNIVTPSKLFSVSAGSYIIGFRSPGESDLAVQTTASSYAVMYEWVVPLSGTYRIYFQVSSSTGVEVRARIFRNDVAVGTERTSTSTSYVGYSQDISGWTAGDLLQIKGYYPGSTATCRVKWPRISVNDPLQIVQNTP